MCAYADMSKPRIIGLYFLINLLYFLFTEPVVGIVPPSAAIPQQPAATSTVAPAAGISDLSSSSQYSQPSTSSFSLAASAITVAPATIVSSPAIQSVSPQAVVSSQPQESTAGATVMSSQPSVSPGVPVVSSQASMSPGAPTSEPQQSFSEVPTQGAMGIHVTSIQNSRDQPSNSSIPSAPQAASSTSGRLMYLSYVR